MDDCDDLKTSHGLAERGDCWWTAQCSHRIVISRCMLAPSAQLECIQAMLHFSECLFRAFLVWCEIRQDSLLALCLLHHFHPATLHLSTLQAAVLLYTYTHTHHARQHRRSGCAPHALAKSCCRPPIRRPSATRIRRGSRLEQDQAFPCPSSRGVLRHCLGMLRVTR